MREIDTGATDSDDSYIIDTSMSDSNEDSEANSIRGKILLLQQNLIDF